MEIRDVIHGPIQIDSLEIPIIHSRYFQRLRQIRQLGFAENSFPGATHHRYIHSLGAMQVATQAFEEIFFKTGPIPDLHRFRAILRLAALLHDIGHGPLSHTTEFAMPSAQELAIPQAIQKNRGKTGVSGAILPERSRKATHEDYTLKMLLDSDLTHVIDRAGAEMGFKAIHVASLIDSNIHLEDEFFKEFLPSYSVTKKIDFRPILKQLISSELDADRMDYLRRDSLYTGVSYGQFDFGWILGNLIAHIEDGKCFLSLHHRALYAFEDFLLSRFHMFLMVYFHHKSLIFDEMLGQYLSSPDCSYSLPADIEKYCETNDAHLYNHLSQSSNPWAKRIVDKEPYRVCVELHSGIPATPKAQLEQLNLLHRVETDLKAKGMHYLTVTSTSELSKYFKQPGDPIFICYDNYYSDPRFIPLEDCTDLFQKYAEKRTITRIYIPPV